MFLNGTVEDKRFILQTVILNSSYYDGKLDVELHQVFDTLFRLSRIHEQNCKVTHGLSIYSRWFEYFG